MKVLSGSVASQIVLLASFIVMTREVVIAVISKKDGFFRIQDHSVFFVLMRLREAAIIFSQRHQLHPY